MRQYIYNFKKRNISLIRIFMVLIVISTIHLSCDDEFLERYPLDQVSEADYWNTASDLEAYMNGFYPNAFNDGHLFRLTYNGDGGSDNMLYPNFPLDLAGSRVVPSDGGWSYSMIRRLNYFLENYYKIEGSGLSFDSYKQYVGEAYFFRAFYYFNLLKQYGDIPYYTEVLTMDSEDQLFAPRTSRQVVVDNILDDLEIASEYMVSGPNIGGNRLNRETALLLTSRIALYEGTWEKYHSGTQFGVTNSKEDDYLNIAVTSALEVIESGIYDIYMSNDSTTSYLNLFNQIDYSNNPEVMLWERYTENYNDRIHNHQAPLLTGGSIGFTKGLVDSYLCSDGLPIGVSPNYVGDNSLTDVSQNRDPRLGQTVWITGDPIKIGSDGDTTAVFQRAILQGEGACTTGYQTKKGIQIYQENFIGGSDWSTIVGTIYFRYAEVLLNYAEAKAELGSITQNDLDITINKLRDRVGMPHLILNNISNDPNWSFPALSPIINEIRRERRVELIAEGFRKDDLFRWRAHELLVGVRPIGAFFDENVHPEIVVGVDLYVNNNGYIDPYQTTLPNGFGFSPDRDYLAPIPTKQLALNPNLEQNPGW